MSRLILIVLLISFSSDGTTNQNIYHDVDEASVYFSKSGNVINTSMTADGQYHYYTDNKGFDHGPTAIFERHVIKGERKIWFENMKIPADVHVSPNGRYLYYLDYGYQPSRVYKTVRVNGEWQVPKWQKHMLHDAGNTMLSSDRAGKMIASLGGDIYEFQQDVYRKMPAQINSKIGEFDPFIAHDGSYILFVREDAKGDSNIYISVYQNADWLSAIKLPEPFNSTVVDGSPYVTPDNKYLFVTSNRQADKTRTWQIPFYNFYQSLVETR